MLVPLYRRGDLLGSKSIKRSEKKKRGPKRRKKYRRGPDKPLIFSEFVVLLFGSGRNHQRVLKIVLVRKTRQKTSLVLCHEQENQEINSEK